MITLKTFQKACVPQKLNTFCIIVKFKNEKLLILSKYSKKKSYCGMNFIAVMCKISLESVMCLFYSFDMNFSVLVKDCFHVHYTCMWHKLGL